MHPRVATRPASPCAAGRNRPGPFGTRREGGFILSTEAILIFTILAIGLFAGVVAVRNAVIKYNVYRSHNRFVVADSSEPPVVLGEAVAFDVHETPLVPFVDYDPEGAVDPEDRVNYRALIGVRRDRFTSRQPVFYTGADCTGSVCLALPGSEDANAALAATGLIDEATGSISHLYAMQLDASGQLSHAYGIGRGGEDDIGILYRGTADPCPNDIASVWFSELPTSDANKLCANLAGPQTMAPTFFVLADEVRDDAAEPVLDRLTPPFRVNRVAPPDAFSFIDPTPEAPPEPDEPSP